MKIIVLKRPKEHGKTETLQLLHSLLIDKEAEDIIDPQNCVLHEKDKEYFVTLNGIKIAIVTLGDYPDELIWHIGYYDALGADILILPERPGVKAIEDKAKNHCYDVSLIDSKLSLDALKYEEENRRDCEEIIKIILGADE